jgi:hypothetical protein
MYTNSNNQLNQHFEGIRHTQKVLIGQIPKKKVDLDVEHEYDLIVYLITFIIVCITLFVFCYVLVKFGN